MMVEALDLALRPLTAFEIGCVARDALTPGRRGAVGAVFERSFYISLGGTEICVGPKGLGAGPLNLRCHDTPRGPWGDWRAAGLRVGMSVLAGAGVLHLPPHLTIACDRATVWTPPPPGPWDTASLGAGLKALDALLPARIPEEGLGILALPPEVWAPSANPVVAAAREPAAALSRFLRQAELPAPDLRALIGLGPGLTPSGDDLIGGALVALQLLGRGDLAGALWERLRGGLARGTNAISRAHLGAAARGFGGAALHAILNDLLADKRDALEQRLAAIDAIGHSSGWDALAGATIALRAYFISTSMKANS